MQIEIRTPYETIADIKDGIVKLPGAEGELEILDNHHPLVINIMVGTIDVKVLNKVESFKVSTGSCLVENNKCLILVEHAVSTKNIDKEALSIRKQELQKQLEKQAEADLKVATCKIANELAYIDNILS